MRGPPPTPTAQLAARGSWRAKKRAAEPQVTVAAPACPDSLQGEARAEWDRMVPELLSTGVLARTDRATLILWCQLWGDYCQARAHRESYKQPWTARKGLAWFLKDTRDALLKIAAQFGFTPAARARLKVEGERSSDDPMEAMLRAV